jgi:hypothetical protein
MIREVEYLSQAPAENFRPLAREAIISITGSDHPRARLRKGWSRKLRLVFDDVEAPFFNAVHFDDSHAQAILAWLKEVEDSVDRVFIHCHAGKHRSAAVAKFIAERYAIPGGIHVYPDFNQRVYRFLTHRGRRNDQPQRGSRNCAPRRSYPASCH